MSEGTPDRSMMVAVVAHFSSESWFFWLVRDRAWQCVIELCEDLIIDLSLDEANRRRCSDQSAMGATQY